MIAKLSALVAGTMLIGAAAPSRDNYGLADFAQVPKFDAHVHANADTPEFLAVARQDGFELLSINVDYTDFPILADQARIAEAMLRRDPVHFHYATTFSMKGFGTPPWSAQTRRALDSAFAKGAIAVKIWKNVGMVERDAAGTRIFIDDPRFDDVIANLESRGVPLIAHQAEPKNCWLPLDEMTTENDRTYFREHPEYYMHLHPEEPGYEMLMAARDHFVAFHPKLNFVGAHMASLEWSVDRLAEFLDRFPNATVDLAARMTQVQYQSVADRAKVRDFFIRYQDRLLYGTDLTQSPPDPTARAQNPPVTDDFRAEADRTWRSDWQYLATPIQQPVDAIKAQVPGLALPKGVIDKIYYRNARRVFRLDR